MTIRKIFMVLWFSYFCPTALAGPEVWEQELARWKIQAAIEAKYRAAIARQLAPELFEISAQVVDEGFAPTRACSSRTLPKISPPTSAGNRASSKATPAIFERAFNGVRLRARLARRLGEPYRASFQKWLSAAAGTEMGSAGDVEVTLAETLVPSGALERGGDSPYEGEGALFGYALAAATLLAAVAFFLRPRDRMRADVRADVRPDVDLPVTKLAPSADDDSFRQLQKRVFLLASATEEKLERAANQWMDEGIDGRRKLAAVIDSVFSERRNLSFVDESNCESNRESTARSGAGSAASGDDLIPPRVKGDVVFFTVCRSFGSLVPLAAKKEILSRAYADLCVNPDPGVRIEVGEAPAHDAAGTLLSGSPEREELPAKAFADLGR